MNYPLLKMSILAFILIFPIISPGAEKTACTLVGPGDETKTYRPKPPTVTIFPGTGTEDEVQVEFTVPSLILGQPDKIKRFKIKDKDGSVNLILLSYLRQNSDTPPSDINTLIVAALKKRNDYLKGAAKETGIEPYILDTSLAMNSYLLQKGKGYLSEEEQKLVITEVLGPVTDYDKNMKYEFKEVENGRYVSRPAKRLADILPPEFYEAATSTSTGGILKDRKAPGVKTCEYLPVVGRLPKAGQVQSIQRPGQR